MNQFDLNGEGGNAACSSEMNTPKCNAQRGWRPKRHGFVNLGPIPGKTGRFLLRLHLILWKAKNLPPGMSPPPVKGVQVEVLGYLMTQVVDVSLIPSADGLDQGVFV